MNIPKLSRICFSKKFWCNNFQMRTVSLIISRAFDSKIFPSSPWMPPNRYSDLASLPSPTHISLMLWIIMEISPSSVSEPFQSSVEFPCVPWKLCIQWVDAVCSFTDNEMNLSGSMSAWRVSGKCISVIERRDAREQKQDFSENIFPSPSLIYFLNYKISTFTLKIDRRGRTNWKAIHREFSSMSTGPKGRRRQWRGKKTERD